MALSKREMNAAKRGPRDRGQFIGPVRNDGTNGGKPMRRNTMTRGIDGGMSMTWRPGASAGYDLRGEQWTPIRAEAAKRTVNTVREAKPETSVPVIRMADFD